jgi:putative zinc finger/helix-turn-helix YgiT family protein
MEAEKLKKKMTFKGVELAIEADAYVCARCGFEAGTIESAGAVQRAIAEAYRLKTGRLTSGEIKRLREAKGLTQHDLADRMQVGIASIKRWETGVVQSKSMDQALRSHLQGDCECADVSGNRPFSIPRIKLVAKMFEQALGKRLLKKADRWLFAAKYIWYGDMVAMRELGRSMTGATYAALPYGPQLNNYRDLLDDIMAADEAAAEPLSQEEIAIITKIARKFPRERMAYDAAHREKVWESATTGALIPYSCTHELTEI